MRSVVAVSLAACVAVLSACGSSSDGAPAGTTARSTGSPATGTAAQAPRRGVGLSLVGRFDAPLYVTSPPGDTRRIFVVEQGGRIRVVRGGKVLAQPFLDIRSRVVSGGEQGLLGLAFPPDYARSKRFYVYYTARGTGADTLAEYRATSPDTADPGSRRILFAQPDPQPNHNGGQLAFGPDGLLYVGVGDGGSEGDPHGNGQSLGTIFGKILRIDPRESGGRPYSIPSDNPFVGRSGARGEIYSYGLRNPWRFSFDRRTGALAIGDVGQSTIEEIDFVRRGRARGANFGWKAFEGARRFASVAAPGAIPPVLQKTHADGWCSITGGYVVRDPALPALRGRYVYGDYCKGQVRSARLRPGGASDDRAVAGVRTIPSLSSFGEDARGRVYAVSLDGPVYRFTAR